MSIDTTATEAALWSRVIHPQEGNLSTQAAQALAQLRFDEVDLDRMHELAVRRQAGDLTDDEAALLQSYRRVGLVLDLLRSKARLSLQKTGCQP